MEQKNENPEITSGSNKTFWLEARPTDKYSPLLENITCDVVVVGAGIAGISVAYSLSKSGKKVVVIDDGLIGSGETGRTSAHLTAALDERYTEIVSLFGEENAKLASESHREAINFIERNVAEESIRCEFSRVPGYLFRHPSDKPDALERELTAAKNAGMEVRMLDNVPGFPNIKSKCLEFANQGQFHPLKYLQGLADAITKRGGRIYTKTHAKEINDEGILTEQGFRVHANHIVVATNTPVNNLYKMHLKQFPFRTYVIGALIQKNLLPKALWWDSGNFDVDDEIPPYHYLRTTTYDDDHDLLLVGGEDHATGLADAQHLPEEMRYQKIREWLDGKIDYDKIIYHWSGQVIEPADALAYIGRNPHDKKNVYIVTGDSGNGLTHGSIAGMLIPDLINGKKNPWEKLYDPSRLKIKSLKAWIKEFGSGLRDYLKNNPSDAEDVLVSEIPKGEGKIIQLDKKKYGAYRDENDQVHYVSAECSHLKCIVKWNNDEKSWDCPCHGSRFTHEGKVLNGPAISDLFYWTSVNENQKTVE